MQKETVGQNTAVVERVLNRRQFLGKLAFAGLGVTALGMGFGRTAAAHTGAANRGGYPDAITHNALDDLNSFIRWLGGAHGYIGEVGIPSNLGRSRDRFSPDQYQWQALGKAYYARCNAAGLWITAQEASEQYYDVSNGGYYASMYLASGDDVHKVINRPGFQSTLIENYGRIGCGVNFSGGQKFTEGAMSNTNPGVYDKDYWYPTVGSNPTDPKTGLNSFQYLAGRGVKLVRLGFRWERMQPRLMGPLSVTGLQRYRKAIVNARAAGLQVVVDLHNYGGYCTSTGRKSLNTSSLPIAAFVDVWRRLSANLASEAAVVAYDLMNEPYNHGGVAAGRYTSSARAWEVATQQAVNAIRARGDAKRIVVPTYGSVSKVERQHTRPWIVRGGGISYTAHQYFDHYNPSNDGGGGTYPISYQDENAYYALKGY